MAKTYYGYILTNRTRSTLYIGITSNLWRRMSQHAGGQVEGFSRRYQLKRLVHYETFNSPHEAIRREKQLKKWNRAWKERLIEETNPAWCDLSEG